MQRALLEQKQKKKRQEPLMVQSNVDGRARTRRMKQSEEQAPLVESYHSSNSSTIYHGKPGGEILLYRSVHQRSLRSSHSQLYC